MTNLQRLQKNLENESVPAILVSDITNVQWLTGFTGSSGFAVVTPSKGVFITDSRYTIQAGEEVKDLPVVSFGSPKRFSDALAEEVSKLGIDKIGFEKSITYSTWDDWKSNVSSVEWIASGDAIKPLRMVKTADEIAKINEACKLADACLGHVQGMLQPGVSEMEISLAIEFFFRKQGAEIGFAPIVASGPNSARPHARPSNRKLENGDFVTLDIGANLNGYNSDITRTFVIGKASDRHKEVYDLVLKAEVECINALVPGIKASEVDGLARKILDEKGLAKYFGHGLGHGLGKAVHDLGSLSQRSEDRIEIGQVWTIEPGVYIEGFGGVRIEDDVHVSANGPEVLTSFPKDLMELN